MRYLRWIFDYMMKHPVMTAIIYFTALVEPLFYMYPMFISADIVNILLSGGGFSEVWLVLIILIPIAVFQVLLFFISSFLNEVLAHRITTDVTYDLFEKMQSRSLSYHDKKDTGEAMTLAMNDTRSLNQFLNPGIRMILSAVTIYLVAGIILSTVNMVLVYILIIILILFTLLVLDYRKKVGPISSRVLNELTEISSITSDTLNNIRDIKSYHSENIFIEKFSRKVIKQSISMELEGRAGTLFYASLVVLIGTVSSISYTIYLLSIGHSSYSELVMVTLAMGLVAGFSNEFKWISFLMSAGLAGAERLHSFMYEEDAHLIKSGDRLFENADITFNNVSFGYDLTENGRVTGYKEVLSDISFEVNAGETIAIVGGPGSGKSSLTKLIQRLYLPDKGEILIGGYNINEFDNSSLRKNMATVEQEIHLFNDTVLENIRFARPDASEEEVIQAAIIAQADEFITELKDGYYTEIGDNGVRLSGGQQQRLAIARALIINPKLLIMDDGASALDARTELRIQQAISEILRARTTVITTHRLAIIAKVDRVLILDKGRLVGYAPHNELILSNKFYRRLFERHYELPEMVQ